MKCGSRMALGVAGGYLLGRSRKMKLAVFLAIMAAGGKLPVDPSVLVRRIPVLGEGGPLEELTGELRGRLVEAGKTAAMTAASSRIDSLSDKLERRTAAMTHAGAPTRPPRAESWEEADEAGYAEDREERRRRTRPQGRGRPAAQEPPEAEYEEPGGREERHLRTRSRPGMTR